MSATRFTDFTLGKGRKTATAAAGAVALDNHSGIITTEALATAAAGVYTLTITNPKARSTDLILANIANATNTTGAPTLQTATPGNGTITVVIANRDGAAALNGSLRVHFAILRNE